MAEKNTELIREENLRQLEQHLRAAADLAASCDLSRSDVNELLELLWETD